MNERIERLEVEAAGLKATKSAGLDQVWLVVGLVAMIGGVVGALLAYKLSLGKSDPRDISSLEILAVGMLAVSVAGAAVFLRYSLGRFLRFWLLRQMYDGQAHVDQVVAAVREPAPPAAGERPAPVSAPFSSNTP
jgi:hypothetical protein